MKKILVIEDDHDLRGNIVKTLEVIGCKTDEAIDGEDGLKKIVSNEYDLILCDINMPKMNGYKLLEKIKKDPEKKLTPFIFITSNIQRDQMREGMNLGADDYLTKPFSIEELMKSIKARLFKTEKFNEFYTHKFSDQINYLEKNLYVNSITEIANEQALLKDLEQMNNNHIVMMDIEIHGYKEVSNFISQETVNKIQKKFVEKLSSCDSKDMKLYHIREENFFILSSLSAENINEASQKIENYCNNLLESIKKPIGSADYKLIFRGSIGVNINISDKISMYELYKNTRIARQYASIKGGDCYYFYSNALKDNFNKMIKENLKKHINLNNIKSIHYFEDSKERNVDNFEIKVFFLYPHSIIQKDIIKEIIYNEYAAYIIQNHEKAKKILQKYTNSIIFINVDRVLSDLEWEIYIQSIMNNPITKDVRIGVLSFYEDEKKMERFLIKLKVPCGFIRLKLGLKECKNIILKALEANEAKGRRKFVRVKCRDIHSVYFSVKINNVVTKGFIYDISSVGMACGFKKDEEPFLKKDTILDEIQLQLCGIICLIKGKIHGTHNDNNGNIIYVIIYEKINYDIKNKIQDFIARCLQENLNQELEII